MDVNGLRSKHRMLKEMSYEPSVLDRGYSGKTLCFDLSDNSIRFKEVTPMMKDKFIGGKGFGLWLLWNAVNDDTKWDSPENAICFSAGPLGGTTSFPGAGKTLVTSISPTTGSVIDSNVGGHFGPLLKFAGFDALEITGKAEKDVIISINSITKKLEIFEAPEEAVDAHVVSEQLTDMYAANEDEKRNISVVAAGKGSDHNRIGCLNFSWWDYRRNSTRMKQAGRGGIGSVFRNKKIKAVMVKTPNMRPKWTIQPRKEKP